MCGRTTLTLDLAFMKDVLSLKHWEKEDYYFARYNMAPTQETPILLDDGARRVKLMRWGLVPSWSKGISKEYQMINARAETVLEKPSFRRLVPRRRCVVLTDGFYEWKKGTRGKTPYYIHSPEGGLLPMAGLWDIRKDSRGGELFSYAIVTTEPKPEIAFIHNRMPVILEMSTLDAWLQTEAFEVEEAVGLLKPYPGDLEAFPVSTFVNSPSNDSPKCIEPAS
ncbi:MAG: SOS response-associated peptidase [Fidelibacterota bacterium]